MPTLFHLAAGASGFDSELDHPLHEFVGLQRAGEKEPAVRFLELTIAELIERLKRAR